MPRRPSSIAAARPLGPPPTISTGTRSGTVGHRISCRGLVRGGRRGEALRGGSSGAAGPVRLLQDPWRGSLRRSPLPLSGSAERVGSAGASPSRDVFALVRRRNCRTPGLPCGHVPSGGVRRRRDGRRAALRRVWDDGPLPAGVVSSRPSRLGDLLPVGADDAGAEGGAAAAGGGGGGGARRVQGGAGRRAGRRPAGQRGPAARADGGGVGGVGGAAAGRGRVGVLPRRAGPGPELLTDGGDAAVGAVDDAAAAAAGAPGRRWRTGGWTGRGPGRSPPSWAGRPASPRTTCSPRSRRWCCRGPPGCRSPGCGRWCARS